MNEHSVKSCLPFAADTGLVLQALLSAISLRRIRAKTSGTQVRDDLVIMLQEGFGFLLLVVPRLIITDVAALRPNILPVALWRQLIISRRSIHQAALAVRTWLSLKKAVTSMANRIPVLIIICRFGYSSTSSSSSRLDDVNPTKRGAIHESCKTIARV